MTETRLTQLGIQCGDCLLFAAIDGLADGLVLVDLEGRIFHRNRRAEEILEMPSRHVIGTKIEEWMRHPGLAAFWERAAREGGPLSAELDFPQGRTIRASVSSCLSSSRDPLGRSLLLHDVTQEKLIHVEVTESLAKTLSSLAGPGPDAALAVRLTRREIEILALLAEGLSNAAVASRLGISANTVGSHLKNLYPKIQARSRAQAAAFAVTHGIQRRTPGRG